MDSILTSVKKLLGLTEEYTAFDADLIMHINSVLMILRQMGVGPQEGFGISDATATRRRVPARWKRPKTLSANWNGGCMPSATGRRNNADAEVCRGRAAAGKAR